jgi:hypothetical protein
VVAPKEPISENSTAPYTSISYIDESGFALGNESDGKSTIDYMECNQKK